MIINILKEQITVNGSKFVISFTDEQGETIKRTPKSEISICVVNFNNDKKINLELSELLKTSYNDPIYSVRFKAHSVLDLITQYID